MPLRTRPRRNTRGINVHSLNAVSTDIPTVTVSDSRIGVVDGCVYQVGAHSGWDIEPCQQGKHLRSLAQ
jgi:hypothetical protein